MPPSISIVMPARDAASTISATVASVLAQSLDDFELLVIDDGSADATADVVIGAAAGDSRVKLLRQPRLGIVAALNHGCELAQGRYIARIDADDRMLPTRLAMQSSFLDAHAQIGVISSAVAFGGNTRLQSGYAEHVAWVNSIMTSQSIQLRRFVESPVAHPSVMFRRNLWSALGGYRDGDFPEDYELWLRWLEAGIAFGKLPEMLTCWHDSPGRLSRTDRRYRPDAFYRLKCKYLARWLHQHVSAERPLLLWGAGRVTRKRFASLADRGVKLAGYVDIDPLKIGRQIDGRPVLAPGELPFPDECFVIVGVGSRGAREAILEFLLQHARQEGIDFILAA
jgi:glycosyltransferase involved in cell wall biosynthesis